MYILKRKLFKYNECSKHIINYDMWINENFPQFVYKGVNYGDENTKPSDHFGKKGGNTISNDIPNLSPLMLDSGEFLTQSEVMDLVRQYQIICKQIGEEEIPLNKLDSKTITYIKNIVDLHS